MAHYFSFFPTLMYANTAAINVIAKVKFEESVSKNLAVFYPYTLEDGERADQVAETYYEDSSYDWIVYLSNGIIDPYNDWPKQDNVMEEYIVAQYGTAANAQIQTAFYRVNYETDDRVISTSAYTALSGGQKKYWSPTTNYNDQVIGYQRKEFDHVAETNRVISLAGTFSGLQENDVIKQSTSAKGTVSFANSSYVVLKHISGEWQTATPVTYSLTDAAVDATITEVTTLSETIPADELSYWTAVSQYEYQFELNQSKKHIRLLSVNYVDAVIRDMKGLLAA
jgi:hypothetical protein